jgi:hypothetical protein
MSCIRPFYFARHGSGFQVDPSGSFLKCVLVAKVLGEVLRLVHYIEALHRAVTWRDNVPRRL